MKILSFFRFPLSDIMDLRHTNKLLIPLKFQIMSAQNSKQGTNSRSAVAKCSCNKLVTDDDPSGIRCHGCVKWFHGRCVSLSDDGVKRLGSRMNCLWICDACLESNSPILHEAKPLSLQNDSITYLKYHQ